MDDAPFYPAGAEADVPFEGKVQVYTGDGKGKTTAALGLALRASGHGGAVYIGQFMKGRDSGELYAVRHLPGVTLEQYGEPGWVYPDRVKDGQRSQAEAGLARAREALGGGNYRIVILDELNVALDLGLLERQDVLDLVRARPRGTELVLTGRNAHPDVLAHADLVTEMRAVKHPFDAGIPARRGIEY